MWSHWHFVHFVRFRGILKDFAKFIEVRCVGFYKKRHKNLTTAECQKLCSGSFCNIFNLMCQIWNGVGSINIPHTKYISVFKKNLTIAECQKPHSECFLNIFNVSNLEWKNCTNGVRLKCLRMKIIICKVLSVTCTSYVTFYKTDKFGELNTTQYVNVSKAYHVTKEILRLAQALTVEGRLECEEKISCQGCLDR